MAKRGRKSDARLGGPRGLIARPLDSFFFLLPFMAFYEIACIAVESFGQGPDGQRVVAFHLLTILFDLLGTPGILLPCFAVIVILLATHIVSGQPWRFRPGSVALMYPESVLWALPIVIASRVELLARGGGAPDRWIADAALCVGAGIYEELVFRLFLISVLVMVGSDLLHFRQRPTLVIAVFVAALLFALHHHPPLGSEPFVPARFIFRSFAGVYLGAIFVFRGYGVAAGAHIAYNLITWSLWPP